MKTLEILNYLFLVLAAMLAVTAIFAFVNGHIIYGICNILWMGCEVIFSLENKHSIEIKQEKLKVYGFLSAMDDTIEEYGSAIITEDEDGKWIIHKGIAMTEKEQLRQWLRHYGMPEENIDHRITQIVQGYGACRYLDGVAAGADAVEELSHSEVTKISDQDKREE